MFDKTRSDENLFRELGASQTVMKANPKLRELLLLNWPRVVTNASAITPAGESDLSESPCKGAALILRSMLGKISL